MKTGLRLLVGMLAIGSLFLFLGVGYSGLASPLGQGTSHYFPETRHTVQGKFWQYWQSHGALAQQGYPISDQFIEVSSLNGKPYTVQYFQRAVFEYHPENRPPYNVLLSQLGRTAMQNLDAGVPIRCEDMLDSRLRYAWAHAPGV